MQEDFKLSELVGECVFAIYRLLLGLYLTINDYSGCNKISCNSLKALT